MLKDMKKRKMSGISLDNQWEINEITIEYKLMQNFGEQ